ncbi:MAG: hypothetical protein ACXAAI_04495 [Promethearchaeota archaeon]|jgi:hypothetical protein
MGFSIKELKYKEKYLLFLTEQELAGPWFSFILEGKDVGPIPIVLKNIEPTPIYNMVNSRTGTSINRITLDFNITEYLKQLMKENKIEPIAVNEKEFIRLYIDIFNPPKVPYISTFFTMKNLSTFDLHNFSVYFIFDLDINGLEGFDNDLSGYDVDNDILYQYDSTGLYGGFSSISRSTHFETQLTKAFKIDKNRLNLSNKLYEGEGEVVSALQCEFQTLKPNRSFQAVLVISGGFSKEELISNIKEGKANAYKHLSQVNRSIISKQRNVQEAGFIKINLEQGKDCE